LPLPTLPAIPTTTVERSLTLSLKVVPIGALDLPARLAATCAIGRVPTRNREWVTRTCVTTGGAVSKAACAGTAPKPTQTPMPASNLLGEQRMAGDYRAVPVALTIGERP
jgi:hypothetical protein